MMRKGGIRHMQGIKITYSDDTTRTIPYEENGAAGFKIINNGLVIFNEHGGWLAWVNLDCIIEFSQY